MSHVPVVNSNIIVDNSVIIIGVRDQSYGLKYNQPLTYDIWAIYVFSVELRILVTSDATLLQYARDVLKLVATVDT